MDARRLLVTALVAILLPTAAADAGVRAERVPLLHTSVGAPLSTKRTCSDGIAAPGAAGVATRQLTISTGGLLDARLHGSPTGADWDLAVFKTRTGRLLGGSAAFGGNEIAQTPVLPGDVVTIQACRRSGGPGSVPLIVDDVVVSGVAPPATTMRLVSIPFQNTQQVDRMAAAGIDLNETAHRNSIDAVLHGPPADPKPREPRRPFPGRRADPSAYDPPTV